jgi:hypothetical protein
MGIFDIFFGSPEKQIKRHGKRVRDKDTQQDDRVASIHWLAENGSPEAIYALLARFEMNYEHQMKDNNEKELVEDLLLARGTDAVAPLEAFIPRTQSFARPLALYQRLTCDEKTLALLMKMLAQEKERSELKAKKKTQVLIKLAEFQDESIAGEVTELLEDFDEGVRYAAAEVLIAQEPTDAIRDALLDRLVHEEEDSNRLRVRIAEVASSRNWLLEHREEAVLANPPQGWTVAGGRLRQG